MLALFVSLVYEILIFALPLRLLTPFGQTLVSVPRRVMSHYTAPDGMTVPTGNWIAVPQLPLMRDPKIWPGGDTFNGFRFVHGDGCSSTRFTHPSLEFPF